MQGKKISFLTILGVYVDTLYIIELSTGLPFPKNSIHLEEFVIVELVDDLAGIV